MIRQLFCVLLCQCQGLALFYQVHLGFNGTISFLRGPTEGSRRQDHAKT